MVTQGPKIRLGQTARAFHREDGAIVDDDDVVSGIVLLRKGANADAALAGIHAKVEELNNRILPHGVRVFPSSTAATWCITRRILCCIT